ncbi:MAG TPA: uroporphyrinogen-III synthase [Candidatus Eisenbacteria bacterium]|jgi:uroporphyrinogen-III synthase
MIVQPLRVAVTREEPPDGPLATALHRHGLTPVPCPAIAEAPPPDPEPLRRAALALDEYQWLVVASARAVRALLEARRGRGLPEGLRTAAVGTRTAAALVAAGALDPLTARVAGSEPLVASLRDAEAWPGRRVLLPRALEGGSELGSALRAWRARVDEVVAYRTLERPPDEIATAWRRAAPDAAVVGSPSAARALVRGVGVDELRRVEPLVAIGSPTAMELVGRGVKARVPPRADFEAIAEMLALGSRAGEEVAAP